MVSSHNRTINHYIHSFHRLCLFSYDCPCSFEATLFSATSCKFIRVTFSTQLIFLVCDHPFNHSVHFPFSKQLPPHNSTTSVRPPCNWVSMQDHTNTHTTITEWSQLIKIREPLSADGSCLHSGVNWRNRQWTKVPRVTTEGAFEYRYYRWSLIYCTPIRKHFSSSMGMISKLTTLANTQMWPICTKPVACRQSSFSATGRNAWEGSYYRFLFYCIYNF